MKYGDGQEIEENLAHRLIYNKKIADNFMIYNIFKLKEFCLVIGISNIEKIEDKNDIIFRIINYMIDNDYDLDDLL